MSLCSHCGVDEIGGKVVSWRTTPCDRWMTRLESDAEVRFLCSDSPNSTNVAFLRKSSSKRT